MGHPAEKRTRATYADVEAAPPNMVAELIDGNLRLQPRPAPRHARASTRITIGPSDGWTVVVLPAITFRAIATLSETNSSAEYCRPTC